MKQDLYEGLTNACAMDLLGFSFHGLHLLGGGVHTVLAQAHPWYGKG